MKVHQTVILIETCQLVPTNYVYTTLCTVPHEGATLQLTNSQKRIHRSIRPSVHHRLPLLTKEFINGDCISDKASYTAIDIPS